MNNDARSASDLVGLALALGARDVGGWSAAELDLADAAEPAESDLTARAHRAISIGQDPLGDAFCGRWTPAQRRPMGATYTPDGIVRAMIAWAAGNVNPARVVDPGAGSARFLVAAGRRFPRAELVAVELDPLAAILARGHLAAAGLAGRARVLAQDYRSLRLAQAPGPTLYVGNPPYVRHHEIEPRWKAWLTARAASRGLGASQLAGLHVHFLLAIAEAACPGDVGVLITAAEWLDVNYGRLARELLVRDLGVLNLQVVEPTAKPFPDADSTAVIACFEVGARPATVGLQRVRSLYELGALEPERHVHRERFEAADRWTPLTRAVPDRTEGYVELGELCRVHRGQVTGANRVWIDGPHSEGLPESVLFPSVTRARELFAAGAVLSDPARLRRVIDLPADLDTLERSERRRVERFLKLARAAGAHDGFIARHRRAWWSVGLRRAAPILATYMARRSPAFVLNAAEARHINVAHGLYPREVLSARELVVLAVHLTRTASTDDGRTYAGGLTKFEPREMERLLVPGPELLAELAAHRPAA